MSKLFLAQTIQREADKEFSDILNTVDVNNKIAAPIHSMAVAEKYRFVSTSISSVEADKRIAKRMNMKSLMQESFFHGAGWLGQNFIA